MNNTPNQQRVVERNRHLKIARRKAHKKEAFKGFGFGMNKLTRFFRRHKNSS